LVDACEPIALLRWTVRDEPTAICAASTPIARVAAAAMAPTDELARLHLSNVRLRFGDIV